MKLLTRDAILAAQVLKTVDVDVPDWGGPVRICMLTASQRDDYDASLSTGSGMTRTLNLHNMRAKLCAISIVDEDGAPVFTAEELGAFPSPGIGIVAEAAQKLNGMVVAVAVEGAIKN